MGRQWTDQIAQRHQLRVYADSSINQPSWRGFFQPGLAEFNALSTQHHPGVTMQAATQPPSPDGRGGGADGAVSAANRFRNPHPRG